jgi:hypothetical protein
VFRSEQLKESADGRRPRLTRPLPVSVFLDLMGLPQGMRDTFVGWAMGLLHAQDRKIAQQSMNETVE